MTKLKSLPKYDLANVQIQEYNYVDQSGPSQYLQKLDMLEPKKEPKVQKEKVAPEIDEDGFETVKSRKKRRHTLHCNIYVLLVKIKMLAFYILDNWIYILDLSPINS